MKHAFYFPHDDNAHSDPKIVELIGECGLAGLGFYWIIIEVLHQQEKGKITQEAFKYYLSLYSSLLDKDRTSVEQVLSKTGLLLKDDVGLVYSDRVLANKKYRDDLSAKRSFAGKKSAESRASPTHVEHMSNYIKEKKGNKKKLNSNNYPSDFLEFYQKYPKQIKKQDTLKSWLRMNGEERARAISVLPLHCRKWTDTEDRFIPAPSVWLNGKRWEDDIPAASLTKEQRLEIAREKLKNL
jgi:hypothetical protein